MEDTEREAKSLEHCSEEGCSSCQVALGKKILSGLGGEWAKGKVVALFSQSADSGSASGLIELGIYYLEGYDDVGINYKKAFNLFKQASELILESNIFLGYCFEHGLGIAKNETEALLSYHRGFGGEDRVEQESEGASFIFQQARYGSHWLKQAIEDGNEHGLARLGILYKQGKLRWPGGEFGASTFERHPAPTHLFGSSTFRSVASRSSYLTAAKEVKRLRRAVRVFLGSVICDAVTFSERSARKTVQSMDVVHALKRQSFSFSNLGRSHVAE